MKLEINCLWNKMKASNSGNMTNNVAAATTPHCAPESDVLANIAKPTVNGRLLSESVIIKGHKKNYSTEH